MAKRAASPKRKKAKPTITKRVAPPKAKGAYCASFEVNGERYESHGDTAHEAVATLGSSLPSMMFKTKAFMTLTRGKLTASFMIFPIQFRRIQGGRTAQEIWAKKLEAKLR